MGNSRMLKLLAGPVLAILIMLFARPAGSFTTSAMAAVTVWMAVWWMTEVVGLAVTALLPMVLLPVLGIADSRLVASQYMDPIIFLFIGGFIIAFSIERWDLHRRLAFIILSKVGSGPKDVLIGVMIVAFVFSMWISNTATVMMLIAAVLAIIYQLEKHIEDENKKRRLASALLIGLAYSSTIGGMSTLVGTPTNMIFLRTYYDTYPQQADMNFTRWFIIAFPLAVAMLFVTYHVIKWIFIRNDITLALDKKYFSNEYSKLGKITYEEKAVATIFCLTAILWFTREDIDFGNFRIPGWSNLFGPYRAYIHDSTVAIFMAVLLFLIPSRKEKGKSLINWEEATKLPFDIILLFGSGFALAKGFEVSGLSTWLAGKLEFLHGSELVFIVIGILVVVCIISEFASNVASIQLVIPILVSMQKVLDVNPLLLMVPATLAASLGFMLPVATAPNTIVFGSKRIRVKDFMKTGIIMDVTGIVLITVAALLLSLYL